MARTRDTPPRLRACVSMRCRRCNGSGLRSEWLKWFSRYTKATSSPGEWIAKYGDATPPGFNADSLIPPPLIAPLHAALRLPRTGAAARADDARGRVERLGDPLDVEHLRGGANAGGGLLRNHAVAAAATITSPSKPWASSAGSRSTPTESTCISSRAARGDVRATELAVRDDSLLFS